MKFRVEAMLNQIARAILAASLILLVSGCQHSTSPNASSVIDVIDYHVSLSPDIEKGVVHGVQTMIINVANNHLQKISFSQSALTISETSVDGHNVEIQLSGNQVILPLPPIKDRRQQVEVNIRYSSQPLRGYTRGGAGIYTEYFACDWMLCQQDSFSDKATVTLELTLPKKMNSIGPGQLVESKWLANGLYKSTWRSNIPYPAYLYAFAFGEFVTAKQKVDDVTLVFVSSIAEEQKLLKLFAPTSDMLKFFEGKAGVSFPQSEYTQLYVSGASAQEALSHSVIGDHWLEPILLDPTEDWILAHELAHQWWGNAVTCSDISEFWLNEGITVFMTAAWKEHRWGREAYERDLKFAKRRHQRAIDVGMDVPLSFDGEYPSLKIRRAIQYSKGALFMDALRSNVGEKAFWSGLRLYTSENMFKTVSSTNLQKAFERASKKDLSVLFEHWVY